jgi:hypothetical protein
MNEVLTFSNLFSLILVLIGFSINRELHHFGEALRISNERSEKGIDEAKESASEAHKRIDNLLIN